MAAETVDVYVPAMWCRHDVRTISRAMQDLDVMTVEVDLATKRVVVRGEVTRPAVCEAIERAGYEVSR